MMSSCYVFVKIAIVDGWHDNHNCLFVIFCIASIQHWCLSRKVSLLKQCMQEAVLKSQLWLMNIWVLLKNFKDLAMLCSTDVCMSHTKGGLSGSMISEANVCVYPLAIRKGSLLRGPPKRLQKDIKVNIVSICVSQLQVTVVSFQGDVPCLSSCKELFFSDLLQCYNFGIKNSCDLNRAQNYQFWCFFFLTNGSIVFTKYSVRISRYDV